MISVGLLAAEQRASLSDLLGITNTPVELDEELARSWAQVWVAQQGQRSIAYALIWLVGGEVQVIDLATAPAARRLGAASALLREIIAEGRLGGFQSVELEVRADNEAALALYERFGFAPRRTRRAYYADGQDALEMGLPL